MKRWPIVLGGTVAGIVGVVTFHTTPAVSGLAATSGAPASSGPAPGASATSSAASQQSGGKRTAVGPSVNYYYGVMSVRVTVSGKKIVNVGIASIDDGGNPRSVMIDQESIPMLEQEVMQAQSASIQGVSGASYTSAGFDQSLQAALHTLGM